VVHVISADLWAGAEVATVHLVRALAERADIDVRVLALNPGELVDRLRAVGVSVTLEPEAGRGFVALARAVRSHVAGADLLHAHRYKENLLAALSGRPWVATQHGRPEPFEGMAELRIRAYGLIDGLAKRLAARRVVAVSREVEAWVAHRVGRTRTVRVWNGIVDPVPALAPKAWKDRALRVGALGRLFPVKGFDLAIDAVAACPGLELEIVGEGPERPALERRIAASGASERIRLLGHEPEPLARIASWRALLVTSLQEGNPISVLEALALGTPVIAAQLPGVAEILEGRGGWLEPRRDTAAWASRLRRIVASRDAGSAASAAARRRYLEAFTAAAAAERMVAVYQEVLGAGRSPASA
jgi:glycosyltransferase involved in cell wall biosynthesis